MIVPSPLFRIQEGTRKERSQVAKIIWGLERLDPRTRDRVITAWVTAWRDGPNSSLEEMLASPTGSYRLFDHVNEVTRAGLHLADFVAREWGNAPNESELLCMCILHDVDKAMIYGIRDGKPSISEIAGILPHGVLGAMMLHDLGFSELVVSSIALHAGTSPFHGQSLEARILHYADFFAAENERFVSGLPGHYQARLIPFTAPFH